MIFFNFFRIEHPNLHPTFKKEEEEEEEEVPAGRHAVTEDVSPRIKKYLPQLKPGKGDIKSNPTYNSTRIHKTLDQDRAPTLLCINSHRPNKDKSVSCNQKEKQITKK